MTPLENRIDVLIIGAGPAGLMCANALAMAGVSVRIIDKRPVKLAAGHADGVQPRTIEVLQSYGLAERLLREGNQLHMYSMYGPDPFGRAQSMGYRKPLFPSSEEVRYPFTVTLHQGAVESIFHDSMKDHGVEVERSKQPVGIEISGDVDEDPSSYPVKVTIQRLDCLDGIDEKRNKEVVHAKYVVGTDGAHSWVRKVLRIKMEGEQTDSVWGVVEMVPETSFPDIRNVTMVRSENGSCMIIPREGDLVRFYVQLSDANAIDPSTRRADMSAMTPLELVSAAREILHPFDLADPKVIGWWTIYVVGQRVASSYSVKERVFIAGDACHTHSPKAGQGMNAGLNDTHNLAWKLVQVLRGWSKPSLLKTYEDERRRYAQDLINFDKQFAAAVASKPKTAMNENGISNQEFLERFTSHEAVISGIGVHYFPSLIVDPKHQKCANNLVVGQRMPPQMFVRAADIRPVEIQDMLPADVRFKVLFFVGSLTEARIPELELLAEELNKPSSFLRKYSPERNISSVFDTITITAGKKEDFNYLLIPAFFRPHWTKVLLDDVDVSGKKGGHGYEKFGIDSDQITLVVVRPDGFVGTITPSTAVEDLGVYFDSFLVSRE